MLFSKRSHEGYLLIDHSESPGITEEDNKKAGIVAPVIKEGSKAEFPTYTCPHCNGVVVINPARTRARSYCQKCDHYMCDACGAAQALSTEHNPFAKIMDQQYDAAHKGLIT